ncbi:MAG TPA: helix-turn-helix transcriptional regulator [Bryobacteraceae bacterium]|nr:helix-turn-helix transcriptional regulator [Bryobacteraceae bacterium]
MATETELLRLALGVYEAAFQPELWTGLLTRLEELTSAGALLLQVRELSGLSLCLCNLGFGALTDAGKEPPATPNPGQKPALSPPAVAHLIERLSGTASKPAVSHDAGGVGRKIVRFLLPHLRRAATIAERMAFFEANQSVLDRLPIGVIFVGSGGAAIQWNCAAAEILHARDGFSLHKGILSAADPCAQARLRKLIQSALWPQKPPAGAAVAVPRPSLRRDYQVMAASLFPQLRQPATPHLHVALLFIIDPERQPPASTRLLIELYKLTRKEAVIAAKLSEGKTIKQAAQELSVTYETARTHLRRIFSKTGTSRQAELLLLLCRLSAADIEGLRG